jgi:hypothetical protein
MFALASGWMGEYLYKFTVKYAGSVAGEREREKMANGIG